MDHQNSTLSTARITEEVITNLKKNFFDAIYINNRIEARNYILDQIQPGMEIAFGGSMTVRSMEVQSYVKDCGAIVLDHGIPGLSQAQKIEIMRKQLTSDIFISSSNAITTRGHLINVDGNGNRVASMIFGPKKVIIVAGLNKIVHSEEEAFKRIEFVAAPLNMKRLNRRTPCIEDGVCHKCTCVERGCRAYTILRKRPSLTPTEVIIVGEMLGM